MTAKNHNSKGLKEAKGISSPHGLEKRLFTLEEAAFYMARSIYSIRTLIWAGQIPIVKNGKKQWIDRCDLETFIEKNKETVT